MSIEEKFAILQEKEQKRATGERAMRELGLATKPEDGIVSRQEKKGSLLDDETRKKIEFFMRTGDLAGIYNVVEHKLKYDPKLTGLLNAQAFKDEVEKTFRRQFTGTNHHLARRLNDTQAENTTGATGEGAPAIGRLGMIFIDLDDFKAINDTRGHFAGDAALKAIAEVLTEGVGTESLREEDIKGRFGGEELVVAIEMEHEGDHFRVAEKIRRLIASTSVQYEGKEFKVTASVGAATLMPGETYTDVVDRANWAMKYGKKHGKNTAVPEEVEEVRAWIAEQKRMKAEEDAAHAAAH
jgi:diguanylate cyclase (GGDEF)-like protein